MADTNAPQKPTGFKKWMAASATVRSRHARMRRWKEKQERIRRGWKKEFLICLSLMLVSSVIFVAVICCHTAYALTFVLKKDFAAQTVVSAGTTWTRDGRLIVVNDEGGAVTERLSYVMWLREAGVRVEVQGVCASACTLYLMTETVCTYPNTVWLFHGLRTDPDSDLSGKRPVHLKVADWLSAHRYPEPLRSWVRQKEWRLEGYEDFFLVSGKDFIGAGWASACPGPDPDTSEERARLLAEISKYRGDVPHRN